MALYLPNSDSLLLLVPKAGSVWLSKAIERAGVYSVALGPDILRGHGYLSLYGRGFRCIGAFVRHPVSWHASYWSYRNSSSSSWDPRWMIDRHCESEDFAEYVERVTSRFPGFVGKLFSRFTGLAEEEISFVGKCEFICTDLRRFLTMCGEEYEYEEIKKLEPQNISEMRPVVSSALERRILDSEAETILRYGY